MNYKPEKYEKMTPQLNQKAFTFKNVLPRPRDWLSPGFDQYAEEKKDMITDDWSYLCDTPLVQNRMRNSTIVTHDFNPLKYINTDEDKRMGTSLSCSKGERSFIRESSLTPNIGNNK
jgi:hypothetical protein